MDTPFASDSEAEARSDGGLSLDLVLIDADLATSPPPLASDDEILLDSDEERAVVEGEQEADEQFAPASLEIIERLRDLARDLLEQIRDRMDASNANSEDSDTSSPASSPASSARRRRRAKSSRKKRMSPVSLMLSRRQTEQAKPNAVGRALVFPRGRSGSATRYGARELAMVMRVAALVVEGLSTGTRMTKRDLFYKDVALFKKQAVVDALLDDLGTTIGARRIDLGIVAASKGLFKGGLRLTMHDKHVLDGTQSAQGCLIPVVDDIAEIELAASVKCILIVEKEAVFRTLADADLLDVLLITGKGYPDLATAELVRLLCKTHDDGAVLCAALVDGDPHGLDILSVYRSGSANRAFDREQVAAPSLGWLGLRCSDLAGYDIDAAALLPLTARDRKKTLSMLVRNPPLPNEMRAELMHMLHRSRKSEIEALPDVVRYVRDRMDDWLEERLAHELL